MCKSGSPDIFKAPCRWHAHCTINYGNRLLLVVLLGAICWGLLMHICRFSALLIGALTLAACASEAPPLDPESVPLPRPAPKSIVSLPRPTPKPPAEQSVSWLHLPRPVSDEELKLDKAKCAMAAKMASRGVSTATKSNLIFADCMHSRGYKSL
jgi:hypothetical protein